MNVLKKKWKILSQKNNINSTKDEAANSSFARSKTFKADSPSSSSNQQQQKQPIYQCSSHQLFNMEFEIRDDDELPRVITNIPSPSGSSTSGHSTIKQSSSKPIDIKYYVPKNTEPEGLSQSVIISDYDYIHRQLVKRYQMNEVSESVPNTSLSDRSITTDLYDNHSEYSTDDCMDNYLSEEDSVSVNAISDDILSKSVPLLSSMSNYPKFEWSSISPPERKYKQINITSSLRGQSEDLENNQAALHIGNHQIESVNRIYNDSYQEIDSISDEDSLKVWTDMANEHYGQVSLEEKQHFHNRLDVVLSETPWDRAHKNQYALERIKHNQFIHCLFDKYSVPMKVTNIVFNARFKQIQFHFHNPNILYMRYIRHTQTVFVIYRSYTEMIKALNVMDSTAIAGQALVCRPSNFTEYHQECTDDLKRKLKKKKLKSKKSFSNGNANRKSKSKFQNQQVAIDVQSRRTSSNHISKRRNNKRNKKKHSSKLDNSVECYNDSCVSSSYYYQCFCYQCTNSLLYSKE